MKAVLNLDAFNGTIEPLNSVWSSDFSSRISKSSSVTMGPWRANQNSGTALNSIAKIAVFPRMWKHLYQTLGWWMLHVSVVLTEGSSTETVWLYIDLAPDSTLIAPYGKDEQPVLLKCHVCAKLLGVFPCEGVSFVWTIRDLHGKGESPDRHYDRNSFL